MRYTAVAVALLAASGALHGLWTHRWEPWSADRPGADRVERIPLAVGEWEGVRVAAEAHTLPEEDVGRGVSVRYTSRTDGSVVTAYLACGPTDGLVSHTPRACYVSNGYTCPTADLRVSPPAEGGRAGEFWASNFTQQGDGAVPVHLRVLWAWSDGSGWQIPGNPRRTFRRPPAIYKLYAIRQVVSPDEPLEGDPALRLLAALVPPLDAALSAP